MAEPLPLDKLLLTYVAKRNYLRERRIVRLIICGPELSAEELASAILKSRVADERAPSPQQLAARLTAKPVCLPPPPGPPAKDKTFSKCFDERVRQARAKKRRGKSS